MSMVSHLEVSHPRVSHSRVSCSRVSCPWLPNGFSNQDFGRTFTLIILIFPLNFNNTSTLNLSHSFSNFWQQFYSYSFSTFLTPTTLLLSGFSNYEIGVWNFELGMLDCSCGWGREQVGGVPFIGSDGIGQPTKWWGQPTPHYGQMASYSSRLFLA